MTTKHKTTSNLRPLKELLTEHLPNHRGVKWSDTLTLTSISGELGVSHETVRRWFKKNQIYAKWINPLCQLEGSTLTPDMLIPYVDLG